MILGKGCVLPHHSPVIRTQLFVSSEIAAVHADSNTYTTVIYIILTMVRCFRRGLVGGDPHKPSGDRRAF